MSLRSGTRKETKSPTPLKLKNMSYPSMRSKSIFQTLLPSWTHRQN
uniref:Uncharacterized protein n=1 Tax=Anguilla anguilla TaxID=7936 RepID=A0A0E9WQ04_ANGAN